VCVCVYGWNLRSATDRYRSLPMRKSAELTPKPDSFRAIVFTLLHTLFTRFDVYVRDTRAKVDGYKSRRRFHFCANSCQKKDIRDRYAFYTDAIIYINAIYARTHLFTRKLNTIKAKHNYLFIKINRVSEFNSMQYVPPHSVIILQLLLCRMPGNTNC